MNIAIVSPWAINSKSIGGTERFVFDIKEAFQAFGHKVTVFSLSGGNSDDVISFLNSKADEINEYLLKDEFKYFDRSPSYHNMIEKCNQILQADKFDFILINSPLFLEAWPSAKKILVLHDTPEMLKKFWGHNNCKRIYETINKIPSHNLRLVSPSKHYAKDYEKILKTKVHTIPHAINIKRIINKSSIDRLKIKYSIPLNIPNIILIPNRLDEAQKNPQLALDAFCKIPESKRESSLLLFAGACSQYQNVMNKLEMLAKEKMVNIAIRSFYDMSDAYSMANIVVLPNKYESFGYSALESIVTGKTVVMNNIPTFRELLKGSGNKNVRLFDGSVEDLSQKITESLCSEKKTCDVLKSYLLKYNLISCGRRYLNLFYRSPELRDLYDGDRKLTGEVVIKGSDIPAGFFYNTVIILITDKYGRILIQKRSKKKGGKFAFTGGHPKSTESSIVGAKTELKEELGIKVKTSELKPLDVIKSDDDFLDVYYLRVDNFDEIDFKISKSELDSIEFVSLDQLIKLSNTNDFMEEHLIFIKYLKDAIKL